MVKRVYKRTLFLIGSIHRNATRSFRFKRKANSQRTTVGAPPYSASFRTTRALIARVCGGRSHRSCGRRQQSAPEESCAMKKICTLVFSALVAVSGSVHAQTPEAPANYPSQAIKLIVPWPVGGGTDAVSRHVAAVMGNQLKQQMVVDNRPGANGLLGTEQVSRAQPNGYTLGIASVETHAINPHVYKRVNYNTQKDFTPIAWVGEFPYAMVVRPDLPVKDVASLVELAKKAPGKMTYASWGIGSSSQIAFEMFKQAAKVDFLHIPFQGAAPAITAIASGQVDVLMVPLSVAMPQERGGRLKMLALASAKRMPAAPNLPTLAEQGFPVEGGTWLAVMGPAGVNPVIVEKVNQSVKAALANKELQDTLIGLGVEPLAMEPDAVQRRISEESARWSSVIKTAGIKLD
ncbi:tripartite tricarboxylate transporter substrate binding protein [Bordetella avium]|nr:tripartite tricarboxylate transporter substrate binding protein [Bordetella avium]